MRRWLRRTIPSMFHRRLLLLGTVAAVMMLTLGVQTTRLTTGESHRNRRAEAERLLYQPTYIPTLRGAVRDRTGAVLARDEPGWEVTVHYRVLTGDWAFAQARAAARATMNREQWDNLGPEGQDAAAVEYLPAYQQQLDELWNLLADLAGESIDEVEAHRDAIVNRYKLQQAQAVARKLERDRTEFDDADITWADAYMELAEQRQYHAVVTDISDSAVAVIENLMTEAQQQRDAAEKGSPPGGRAVWLQVRPQRARHRRYPLETVSLTLDRATFPGPLRSDEPVELSVPGLAMHMIGRVRRIHAGDAPWGDRPFIHEDDAGRRVEDLGGYRDRDRIGAFGVERSMESTLRGSRGKIVRRLDTGIETEHVAPRPGDDVVLTIDHRLQARVQALMSHDPRVGLMLAQPWHHGELPLGTPLHGAAVVMEIDTGEILAAVSVPGITLDQLENDSDAIYGDHTNVPAVFRPTAYPYPPGSTVKPLVLAAAISEGVLGPHETIDCSRGYLYEGKPTIFRDWLLKDFNMTFGILDGATALKVSSNTFFGALAQRLGYERVHTWFTRYGAGRTSGVGIEDRAGTLFSLNTGAAEAQREADQACIGQGKLTMTPVQLIAAHASLGRGGVYLSPTLVRGAPQRRYDLQLSPAAVSTALRGMWKSANEAHEGDVVAGTTYLLREDAIGLREPVFNVTGVTVYGKSGSAQCAPLKERFDDDGDGYADRTGKIVRSGSHAWTVALVKPDGAERPTVAVAVVVEHGGSGGRTAGPIVNQIIHALQIEGYLPGDSADSGATSGGGGTPGGGGDAGGAP